MGLEGRRDRIETGLQRIERFDEGLGVGANAAELLDRGEHVEGGSVAVGVVPGAEGLGLLPTLAAGDVGIELEQHVRRRAERDPVGQHVAQGAAADREICRRAQRGDYGIDQYGVVDRHDSEAVADDIIEAGFGEV
jgi:hypothetical protein